MDAPIPFGFPVVTAKNLLNWLQNAVNRGVAPPSDAAKLAHICRVIALVEAEHLVPHLPIYGPKARVFARHIEELAVSAAQNHSVFWETEMEICEVQLKHARTNPKPANQPLIISPMRGLALGAISEVLTHLALNPVRAAHRVLAYMGHEVERRAFDTYQCTLARYDEIHRRAA